MSIRKLFKTNESLENEGIWIEYFLSDDEKPYRFKVARHGGQNKAYKRRLREVAEKQKIAIRNHRLDQETEQRLQREVFAETVLIDWENITDGDDKPMNYSKENSIALLAELPELYAALSEEAGNMSLFLDEVREDDLGNSGKSLSTDSSKGQPKA